MNESNLIKAVNCLLFSASVCLFYGLAYMVTDSFENRQKDCYSKTEIVQPDFRAKVEKPSRFPVLFNAKNELAKETIICTRVNTEYIGTCFITAYCPWECGYNGTNYPKGWMTSSGAVCHYEDEWNVPTTCAIDRHYFSYSDIIQVGDPDDPDKKIYICEDTGAFSGMWVDCFVESMSEVRSWNSSYRPVYAVTYEKTFYTKTKSEVFYEHFTDYLYGWCYGYRIPCRNDC